MEREKINIRNMYIELLNKIKNVEGVDKDYVDDLIEVVDLHLNALDQDLSAITNVIPEEATVTNKLVSESEIQDIELDIETITSSISAITLDVSGIKEVIPSGATSSNKLATASDLPKDMIQEELYIAASSWSSASGSYYRNVQLSNDFDPSYIPTFYIHPDDRNDAAKCASFRLITSCNLGTDGDFVLLSASAQPTENLMCVLEGKAK